MRGGDLKVEKSHNDYVWDTGFVAKETGNQTICAPTMLHYSGLQQYQDGGQNDEFGVPFSCFLAALSCVYLR